MRAEDNSLINGDAARKGGGRPEGLTPQRSWQTNRLPCKGATVQIFSTIAFLSMKTTCLLLAILCPAILPAQRVATEDSEALTVSGKLYYHFYKAYSPASLLEDGLQAAVLQRG